MQAGTDRPRDEASKDFSTNTTSPASPAVAKIQFKKKLVSAIEVTDRLKVRISKQGQTTVVKLMGDLDLRTVQIISRLILDEYATPRPSVVIDLSSLDQIDSFGVGAILALYKHIKIVGGSFEIIGLNSQPHKLFSILGLERLLSSSLPRR